MSNATERTLTCQYWDAPEYKGKCPEPAFARWAGKNYCRFHYGKPNAEMGINEPDEVPT